MLRPDVDVALRPPPPAPARVARRALVLFALACRSQLEPHAGDAEARAVHEGVRAWLAATGLDAEAEDDERRILATPLGQLSREDCAHAGWRGEGAATLAWGLGRAELPPIATPVDASELAPALGWLDDGVAALLDEVRLRARTDVPRLAEMLEAAQWRLERDLAGGERVGLGPFAAGGFDWPRDAAPLELAPDGDLALGGRALAEVPEHERRVALRIVLERRRAAGWLAGQQATYSAVTLDT